MDEVTEEPYETRQFFVDTFENLGDPEKHSMVLFSIMADFGK